MAQATIWISVTGLHPEKRWSGLRPNSPVADDGAEGWRCGNLAIGAFDLEIAPKSTPAEDPIGLVLGRALPLSTVNGLLYRSSARPSCHHS